MFAIRLIVATLAALALADCGNMHACTADGVPCSEASTRPLAAQSSGGARPPPAPLFPTSTVAANAPFVPPVVDAPAAAPAAPDPLAVAPAPAPTTVATVTETTNPAAEPEEEDSGRHHGRHGRHGRRHRSGGGSHHRRHH